jgi:hypothetical protein
MSYEQGKNLGVLIAPIKYGDYVLGGISGITKEVLQSDRDYTPWLPTTEYQFGTYGDTYGCVTFSALNSLEILFKRKYNIDINFSDRFTVVLSGTKRGQGNYLTKVGDSIRKEHGLVKEETYPWDRAKETLDDYYDKGKITKEMYDEGLNFLANHEVKYQWVLPNALNYWEALQYGPVQVTVNTTAKEVDGVIQPVNSSVVHHAVTMVKAIKDKEFIIFDHYLKNIKRYAWNFNFGPSLQYSLVKKNMKLIQLTDPNNKTIYLVDAEGNRRAFYDVAHFQSVAPALGLAKRGSEPDWSQVQKVSEEEVNSYPLGRPMYIVSD